MRGLPRDLGQLQGTCNNRFNHLLHYPHKHLLHHSLQHFPYYPDHHLPHSVPTPLATTTPMQPPPPTAHTNCHKKYILLLKQPQTSLITSFITYSKSSTSTSTATAKKFLPKLKIPPPTNPKATPKHFNSFIEKKRSPKNTTPTTITATTQTIIPTLVNINTRLSLNFVCEPHIHFPLSSYISLSPTFPANCRNSNNRNFGGRPRFTYNNSPKK